MSSDLMPLYDSMTEMQSWIKNETTNLVRGAQQGDRLAVEELFARYVPRVRQIVALRTGRRLRQFTGLDDVAQEVLLKAFRDFDRFEHKSEGSFRNWLAKCVECEVASLARKVEARKRGGGRDRELLLSSILAGTGPTPSQVAQARELEERIEEALLDLPTHYREVIILRTLCEMSFSDIAKEMGFANEVSARKAFSRARAKLSETMQHDS